MSLWKNKIIQHEITPPENAWAKISKRRQFSQRLQWGFGALAIAGALVTIGGLLVTTPNKESSTAAPLIAPVAAHSTNQPSVTETPSSHVKTTSLNFTLPNVDQVKEQASPESNPQNPFPFPYNGSVQSTATTRPTEITSASEQDVTIEANDVTEEQEPITEENVAVTIPSAEERSFVIADHFSPNKDGWNDEFSPALQLPEDFHFIQWSLYRNQQWIRTWNENTTWNGLDLGGYPMESGTYGYVLTYEDDQKVVRNIKGIISLQR